MTERAKPTEIEHKKYRYEAGGYGGFIILRWQSGEDIGTMIGWAEIGEWYATEQEVKEAVAYLEARDGRD